jgi:hypothetical protein
MHSLRRCFAAALPILLVECSGDSPVIDDGGADATTDTTTQDVSSQDVSTNDSGSDAAPTDSGATDASDASADAGDAAPPLDAAVDSGLAGLCMSTGGTVSTGQCCKNTTDFPSTCTTGPCGCSPQNSHTVQTCSCPTNKCFTQQLGCH